MIGVPEALMLFELARQTADGCIVEIGSYRGRSAIALSLGTTAGRDLPVYAIEPHDTFTGIFGGNFGPQDRAAFYRGMLRSGCYRNVRLLNASSDVLGPGWNKQVGLLWIDGDHSAEAVRRDFANFEPHMISGAVVVFDDSRRPDSPPTALVDQLVRSGIYAVEQQAGGATALRRVIG